MQIVDDKAILLKTRNPNKYSIIPKHKVISESNGTYEVLVYWGLEEVKVLRNLGVKDAPSPIVKRYSWPGRYKPMDHQRVTSEFLTLNRKAFVFSEPGTGKTLSALWAADYLMGIGKVRRVLILCPLSIMQSAWLGDLSNSIIHRSAVVAHHAQSSRRIEMVQQNYEFVITNYDGLNLIADEVRKDGRFDLVIVDEANAYKTQTTRRWKAPGASSWPPANRASTPARSTIGRPRRMAGCRARTT
jgi:SNF2 family DNA or RNA helicase